MRRRGRHPGLWRWAIAIGAAGALGAAALSPWWSVEVQGGPRCRVVAGNGGVRVWWLDGGRTYSATGLSVSASLGRGQDFLGWGLRCAPTAWAPNAWIPAWMLVAPLAFAAVVARPWRRPAPGSCQACGYSLVGVPAGRCPECGREFGGG